MPCGTYFPLLDSEMEGNIKKLSSFSHQLFIVSPSPLEAEAGTLAQTKDTMIAKRLLTLERRILLKRLSRHALVVDWDTTSSLGNVLGGLK